MQKCRGLEVEYSKVPSDIYINEKVLDDHDEYPFVVTLQSVDNNAAEPLKGIADPENPAMSPNTGVRESIRAKYVVACDGAHSWTRKRFTIPFDGDQTDSLWGEKGDLILHKEYADQVQALWTSYPRLISRTFGKIVSFDPPNMAI